MKRKDISVENQEYGGEKKYRKRFASVSLRRKLIILFAGATFISMSLLGTVMFINVYNTIKESLSENAATTVTSVAESMNQSFVLAENVAMEVAASEGVQNWLDDGNYYDRYSPEYYLRKAELSKEMNRILIYSNAKRLNMIEYVSVFVEDELLEYADIQSVGDARIRQGSEEAYRYVSMDENKFVYSALITYPENIVFNIRKMCSYMDDKDTNSQLSILVGTKEREIYQKYAELTENEGAVVYLIDNENRILSSSREDEVGTYMDRTLTDAARRQADEIILEQPYLMDSAYLQDAGMRLIYLYPKRFLAARALEGLMPYVLISVSLIAVCICAAVVLGLNSTKFLNEFVWAMQNVKEKNYDVKIRKYKDPEIDRLGQAFNEMTAEIKELIQNKYESQLLLNEMEIRFLQHQMNPHLLFNVLLTIQIKAKRCKDESIYRMVATLSALLRASIYTNNVERISVREELKYAEFYLYLQKMRFEDKISYEINIVDESLADCIIPKFVIEPIVENAVIHGLEDLDGPGHIVITVKAEENCLVTEVEDNGVGFDVEKYKQSMKDSAAREDTGHAREKIGLNNVDLRIRHIYGKQYGVKIRSEINKGTIIRIIIPLEEDENNV